MQFHQVNNNTTGNVNNTVIGGVIRVLTGEKRGGGRLKVLRVTPALILDLCQGGDRPFRIKVINPIPDTARIESVEYVFHRDAVQLTLSDDSFEEVSPGDPIPFLHPSFTRVDDPAS